MKSPGRPVDEWFNAFASSGALAPAAAAELHERGFVVLPGAVPSADGLSRAYDAAVAAAAADDIKIGSTTTRVNDFVDRGPEFEALYLWPPLLEAAGRVIGRPFKLSSYHARTLHPKAPAEELHVDVARNSGDWPLASFILMVDDFRTGNGATRFLPGSHHWPGHPRDAAPDRRADHGREILALGAAGSLLVFNGSAWHGHSANFSGGPRRSLQGAFIPRDGRAGTDFAARMRPETRARLETRARYVLAV